MEAQVVEAVKVLYSPESFPASRKEAGRFLEAFQNKVGVGVWPLSAWR